MADQSRVDRETSNLLAATTTDADTVQFGSMRLHDTGEGSIRLDQQPSSLGARP
jgi:hypothetical protein